MNESKKLDRDSVMEIIKEHRRQLQNAKMSWEDDGLHLIEVLEKIDENIIDQILSLIPQPKYNEDRVREILERNTTIPVIEIDDDGNKFQTGKELDYEKAIAELSSLPEQSDNDKVIDRPLVPFNKREYELLLDQLYRFEGILGKYNCQHGGLKCNFQTNCHRLLRAEINKLKKERANK